MGVLRREVTFVESRVMSASIVIDSQDLALKLRAFLEDVDTARWRTELEAVARQRVKTLESDLNRLLASWPNRQAAREMIEGKWQQLETRLSDLSKALGSSPRAKSLGDSDIREQWRVFRERLQKIYEALVSELRTLDIHVPSLRPTNYTRSLFHVSSSIFTFVLIQYVFDSTWLIFVAAAFALSGWTMETARRFSKSANDVIMKVFTPVAHPHEFHRINSATWYASALLLLSFTGSALVCSVGVIVLGFSDPAAALIGRRFGRTSLINGRSLEGTLTFILVGVLSVLALIRFWHPAVSWSHALLIAFVASLFGGVAELVSARVDDNMTIPLSAALGCGLVALACGIPL
jgi:dolichol kinase